MKTIKELKAELEKYPEDAEWYAYEGEVVGIVIRDKGEQIGIIENKRRPEVLHSERLSFD